MTIVWVPLIVSSMWKLYQRFFCLTQGFCSSCRETMWSRSSNRGKHEHAPSFHWHVSLVSINHSIWRILRSDFKCPWMFAGDVNSFPCWIIISNAICFFLFPSVPVVICRGSWNASSVPFLDEGEGWKEPRVVILSDIIVKLFSLYHVHNWKDQAWSRRKISHELKVSSSFRHHTDDITTTRT